MFKQLIVLLAVGIYAVSCNITGDNKVADIDFEHTAYSDSPAESHYHEEHHFGDNDEDEHLEGHDLDNLREEPSKVKFPGENQYKGERGISSPPTTHFSPQWSPPSYESLPNKLPTIEENRVLPDETPIPPLQQHQQHQQQRPHLPLRDRVAKRLSSPGSGTRPAGSSTSRADMKDYAINLRNNPKVVRGLEAVRGKTASFKDRLSTIKAKHDQKKAERLNLHNGANFNGPVPSGSFDPLAQNNRAAPVEFEAAPATDYNKVSAFHH